MRRKFPPQPLARPTATRPLSSARSASRLPTAAALAIALASLGCGQRGEDVTADPVAVKTAPVSVPTPTAPSASAGPGLNAIDPEPHALAGEPAIVAPVPSTTTTAIKHVPTAPSHKLPRHAGVRPNVKTPHASNPYD